MEEKTLVCPFCNCDCVHLESVMVNRGGELTQVDSAGTKLKSGSPSGRGARVETVLFCENGCKWVSAMQFHKGSVLVEDNLASKTSGNFSHDLWRD